MNRWVVLFVFILVGFGIYHNALSHQFMMDDDAFFSDEQMVNPKYFWYQFLPDREKVLNPAQQIQSAYYRPIAHIIPMLSNITFKQQPQGYHIVNLLLFVILAWVIYGFFAKVFNNATLGFCTGLLFLVHPINGVIVNYKTANAFALEGIFMLLALYFVFKNHCDKQTKDNRPETKDLKNNVFNTTVETQHLASPYNHTSKQPRSLVFGLWSLVFFLLSLMCHETAMALPFYAFVLLIACQQGKRDYGGVFKTCLPLFITLLIYFIFRLKFASLSVSILGKFAQFKMNPLEYVASLVKLLTWYVGQVVYPRGIVLILATPVVRGVELWWLSLIPAVGYITYFIYHYYFKPKELLFAAGWFLAGCLPFTMACLFQPMYGLMMEPHWFIVASLGYFLFLAWIFVVRLQWVMMARIIFIALILAWSAVSYFQNKIWDNAKIYCHFWLNEVPTFTPAAFYLARAYEKEKNTPLARQYYQQVLKQGDAQEHIVYMNLGVLDLYDRKPQAAIHNFVESLKRNPKSPNAYNCLGAALRMMGHRQQAIPYFNRARALSKSFILPRINLGQIYIEEGRWSEAIAIYQEILHIKPDEEEALKALMGIYIRNKDKDHIIELANMILWRSQQPQSLTMAGSAFSFYNDFAHAAQAFSKAIAINPQFNDVYQEQRRMLKRKKEYGYN